MKKREQNYINTSDWGGPGISLMWEDVVTIDEKAIDAAIAKAFSEGVNALFDDLSIIIQDDKVCIVDVNYEDYAVIPLEKFTSDEDMVFIKITDYVVQREKSSE